MTPKWFYFVTTRRVCVLFAVLLAGLLHGCGRGGLAGYQNTWLHPQDISTVYVEMFDADGFRRSYEFKLTEAVGKHIEARTPYKIVSDRSRADSILSGTIGTDLGVIAGDRYTGRPLEREVTVRAEVTWKDLRTGRVILDNETVYAFVDYSELLGQTFEYAADASLNKAAQMIVELMEQPW